MTEGLSLGEADSLVSQNVISLTQEATSTGLDTSSISSDCIVPPAAKKNKKSKYFSKLIQMKIHVVFKNRAISFYLFK